MSTLNFTPLSQERIDGMLRIMEECEGGTELKVRNFLAGNLVTLDSFYDPDSSRSATVLRERAKQIIARAEQTTNAIIGATEQYQTAYRESLTRLAQGENPRKVSRDLLARTLNEAMGDMDNAQRVRLLSACRALQRRVGNGIQAAIGAGNGTKLDETVSSASGEDERLASERVEQLLQTVLDDSSFERLADCDIVCLLASLVKEGVTDEELAERAKDAQSDREQRLYVSAALYVELEMTRTAKRDVDPWMVAVTVNRLADEGELAKEIAQGYGQVKREQRIAAIATAVKVVATVALVLAAIAGIIAVPTVLLVSIAEFGELAVIAKIVGAALGITLTITYFDEVYDICESVGEDVGDKAENCARSAMALSDRMRGTGATAHHKPQFTKARAEVNSFTAYKPATIGS